MLNRDWPRCTLLAATSRPRRPSIRDALERPTWVPSKELPPATELQRAPLLAAHVEIAIADGNIDAAQAAADELAAVAIRFQSKALAASAAHGRAQVRLA